MKRLQEDTLILNYFKKRENICETMNELQLEFFKQIAYDKRHVDNEDKNSPPYEVWDFETTPWNTRIWELDFLYYHKEFWGLKEFIFLLLLVNHKFFKEIEWRVKEFQEFSVKTFTSGISPAIAKDEIIERCSSKVSCAKNIYNEYERILEQIHEDKKEFDEKQKHEKQHEITFGGEWAGGETLVPRNTLKIWADMYNYVLPDAVEDLLLEDIKNLNVDDDCKQEILLQFELKIKEIPNSSHKKALFVYLYKAKGFTNEDALEKAGYARQKTNTSRYTQKAKEILNEYNLQNLDDFIQIDNP